MVGLPLTTILLSPVDDDGMVNVEISITHVNQS